MAIDAKPHALIRRLRAHGVADRFPTDSFSPIYTLALRLLWTIGLAGLVVFTVAAAGGPGDTTSNAYQVLYVGLYIVAGALCLLRAWLVREQRLPWAVFGIGMWSYGVGAGYWWFVLAPMQSAPYPSASDALWLGYFAGGLVGIAVLARSGLTRFRRRISIDLLVGAIATATVGTALLLKPISDLTGGDLGSVATNLAYPVLDAVIVSLVLNMFIVYGWRPGRVWVLLALAWILQTVVDTLYVAQVAGGTYVAGGMLDVAWPPVMLLVAWAAWQRPAPPRPAWEHGPGTVAFTSSFAAVSLVVLIFDLVHEVGVIPSVLVSLAVTFGFIRASMTFAHMQSLAAAREMQRSTILDAAGEGIVGTDPDGLVTFMNPAGKRMTGYVPGELTGRSLHATLHHTKAGGAPYPVEECPMHASLLDGAIHHCDEDVYWRKDGSSFPVEYTSTPIVEDGRIQGAVVVFRDITERRNMERIKNEFTSVVSHELRTPLTSIRGSLGLLESGVLGPLSDRAQRMTQIAVDNTDRLVRLINDILDLERLDSEGLQLRQSTCDAEQLIARATDGMLAAALAAEVTLAVDSAHAAVEADADRIIQTLTNLIGNAVKFSPRGGTVQITSLLRGDDILFTVSDGGRGIPADKLESIFGRFQQVDSSDSRQSGGTGLGLAICRSIVEHHGGRIWALSTGGDGSTFSFTLPAAPDPVGAYTPRPGGTCGSVLLCGDDAETLEVTGRLLEERGYHVMLAGSGEAAVQRALAEPPDVLLLELSPAGTTGAQTVAALREHADTATIPVVVLSVLPRSEEKLAESAFMDWIEKPAAPGELFAALDRAIGPADDVFRTLLIEPDPGMALLLRELFARYGVACYAASSGPQALAMCAQVRPDVLLLDDRLPPADGLDVRRWLHGQSSNGELPIITYDAGHVQSAEHARRSIGAVTQILTKGQISPEEFQWRVMTLLARPHIQRRTPEPSHELEAHPAHR